MLDPVVNDASLEAKNAIALATSIGSPTRKYQEVTRWIYLAQKSCKNLVFQEHGFPYFSPKTKLNFKKLDEKIRLWILTLTAW